MAKVGRPKNSVKRINYSTRINEKTKKTLDSYKAVGVQGNDIIECLVFLFFDYLNPAILNAFKAGTLTKEDLHFLSYNHIQNTDSAIPEPNKKSAQGDDTKGKSNIGFAGTLDNFIDTDDIIF